MILAVAAFALTGCNEDDFTGDSTMQPVIPFPGITLLGDLPVGVIMVEKDTTMEFELVLATPQTVDVSIKISVDESSTAEEGSDFALSTTNVTIPAFTTTGSFEVSFFRDGEPEDDETAVINIGDQTTANAVFETRQMTVVLTNYFEETMDIEIDWEGEFEFAGMIFPICPNVDIDPIALADNAGTYSYSDDWGACPEFFSMVGDGQPTSSGIGGSNIVWGVDSYTFLSDLYSNALFGYGLGSVEFPITVTVQRLGITLPFDFLQRADQTMNGDDPGYAQDGNGTTTLMFVLDIEAGNVYKFYDPVNSDLILETRTRNILNEARRIKSVDYPGHTELVQ